MPDCAIITMHLPTPTSSSTMHMLCTALSHILSFLPHFPMKAAEDADVMAPLSSA